MVLAKPEHENRFSHVFSDSVKTGIANALGLLIAFSLKHLIGNAKQALYSTSLYVKKLIMCVFVFKGNKGAVGVSFMFNRTSFGFVNSHLTSGSEKKLR